MLTGFFEDFTRKPIETIGRYWGGRVEICDFAKDFKGCVRI
jgi:hypothetical protein